MESLQGSKCRSCDAQIYDLTRAMLAGCPKCHSRNFTFIKKSPNADPQESLNDLLKSNEISNIGIKVIERGRFVLDIKALAENRDENDPVIVEDQRGIINIVIDTEE